MNSGFSRPFNFFSPRSLTSKPWLPQLAKFATDLYCEGVVVDSILGTHRISSIVFCEAFECPLNLADEVLARRDLPSVGYTGHSGGFVDHGSEVVHPAGDWVLFTDRPTPMDTHAHREPAIDRVLIGIELFLTMHSLQDLLWPRQFEKMGFGS